MRVMKCKLTWTVPMLKTELLLASSVQYESEVVNTRRQLLVLEVVLRRQLPMAAHQITTKLYHTNSYTFIENCC
jgi:hypothetical protein